MLKTVLLCLLDSKQTVSVMDCKFNIKSSIVVAMWLFLCKDYESSAVCSVKSDAVTPEVNETHSPMKPVVMATFSLAHVCCVICYIIFSL